MRHAPSLSSTIESIRPRFLGETAQRLGRMRELRAALDQPGALDAAMGEIRFAAHKTTGIAATLGYAALGRVAQDLDAALVRYDGRSVRGPLPEDITVLVDAVMDEMARATKTRPDEVRGR